MRRFMLGSKERDGQFLLDRQTGRLYRLRFAEGELFDLDSAPAEARDFLEQINKGRRLLALLRSGRLGRKLTEYREWDTYGPAYPRPGAGARGNGRLIRELQESGELLAELPINPTMDSDERLRFYRYNGATYALYYRYMGSSWGADFDHYEVFIFDRRWP